MSKYYKNKFRIDWVSRNHLAIGTAPKTLENLEKIKKEGIGSILTLCSEKECKLPEEINLLFNHSRMYLPDHKAERAMEIKELKKALDELNKLLKVTPVFIHCVAAMERSPLVCIAWLVKYKNLSFNSALDYMMQAHPGTNPLAKQLNLINNL